jgi:hypothetical protein
VHLGTLTDARDLVLSPRTSKPDHDRCKASAGAISSSIM